MKRYFLILAALLILVSARGASNLGDFVEDATLHFEWSTRDTDGAPITRSTDGTIYVKKDNATTSSAGITNVEDADGVTGQHECTIDLSADAFYATGSNYSVVLYGAVIDSVSVTTTLREFSIQNRYMRGTDGANTTVPDAAGTAAALHAITDALVDDVETTLALALAEVAGLDGAAMRGTNSAALASTFTGITSMAHWLGAIAGKQASNATAQTEMRATGAGSGTYDATADSQEAIRDRGDAAWTGGGGGDATEAKQDTIIAYVDDLETSLALVLADTNELQTNQGNWLTAVGFSTHSAADVWAVVARTLTASTNFNDLSAADVNAEVDTALSDIKLDHLAAVADADDVADSSIIAKLASRTSDWSTFVANTDSMEGLRGELDSVGGSVDSIYDDLGDVKTFTDQLPANTSLVLSTIDTVVDAVKVVTDRLATSIELDGAVYRFTANALERAPTELGNGPTSYTLTVDDGTDPLDGVFVRVTTDVAGAVTAASGTTDASGEVTFMLDNATYYTWKQLSGYNFTNPGTIIVS